MLVLLRKYPEIRETELMMVYAESNRENAEVFHPGLEALEAIGLVEQDFLSYLRRDFFREKGAFCAVWEEFGCYCSALRMQHYLDGWLLSALETAPNLRRRGFGQMLVQAVQETLAPGEKLYSHVSRRNKASQGLHKNCGFSVFRDVAVYLDGSADAGSDTLLYVKP